MRLSIDPNEVGYYLFKALQSEGCNPRVYLDGVKQEHVITADESKRFIIRFARDEQGEFKRDANDCCLRETVVGEVKILLDPEEGNP